jgi:hypothetical protein
MIYRTTNTDEKEEIKKECSNVVRSMRVNDVMKKGEKEKERERMLN